jgi:glutathione S-transferase
MWRLHQFTLCPFSRKVRLALGEKGGVVELVTAQPWEREEAFAAISPTGQTPALEVDGALIGDSVAIAEYVDEALDGPSLIGDSLASRAETRRLIAWFDQRFYTEVGVHLLRERMIKRVIRREPPEGQALRRAARAVEGHLDYLDWLLDTRRWLAGERLGMADLAAAAHLSVADYLSGIDWSGHASVKAWYSAMKSRPTMRRLLAERTEGLFPPAHYDKLDF